MPKVTPEDIQKLEITTDNAHVFLASEQPNSLLFDMHICIDYPSMSIHLQRRVSLTNLKALQQDDKEKALASIKRTIIQAANEEIDRHRETISTDLLKARKQIQAKACPDEPLEITLVGKQERSFAFTQLCDNYEQLVLNLSDDTEIRVEHYKDRDVYNAEYCKPDETPGVLIVLDEYRTRSLDDLTSWLNCLLSSLEATVVNP